MIRYGQAPHKSLLIGSGRLARHLEFYLQTLDVSFSRWDRRSGDALDIGGFERIWLAIRDDALPELLDGPLAGSSAVLVHFSGAYHDQRSIAAHPLMTFGPELYPADFYPRIHFTVSGGVFHDALPGLPNPWTPLSEDARARYHALCVLGGNFPMFLWRKMNADLAALGLPRSATDLYLRKILENYLTWGEQALTGPLVRGDRTTIERNLKALDGDPWQAVYRSFVEATQ